jgi:hypothetical protein
VRFENGTDEVPGLVTDFSTFGPVNDTNRWVMLLYSTSTELPLRWRAAGVSRMSTKPGCWEPKDLRLAGVLPGQSVALSVALLETKPSAPPFDLGVQHWRTDAFPYVHDAGRPNGSAIKGFRGLGVPAFCLLRPLPEAAVVEVVVFEFARAEQAGEVGAFFFFEQRDSRLSFSEAEAVVPVFALGVVIQP